MAYLSLHPLSSLPVCMLVLFSTNGWAADLSQVLEQEAAQVAVDAATVNGSTRAIANYHSDRYEQFMAKRQYIPAGLSQQELKLYLFNEFYETYANYAELSKDQQQQVYRFYQQQPSAELSAVDNKILALLPHE